MWLYIWLCGVIWSVNADENITETWNSTSSPFLVMNLTSEWLNSDVPSTTSDPLYNETDASNFIATDYGNTTYLEHFTKFNWTVLDTFDNTFGGTNDIGVNSTSRHGHERNLMVVLPVMQGNSDLSNSKLQVLYTKPPVTAIIGGEQNAQRRQDGIQARTTIKIVENQEHHSEAPFNHLERIDHDPETSSEGNPSDTNRNPYTEFILDKPSTKSRSPLDYGYPETFKFIEDFNELPKNHRPDWSLPDTASTVTTKKSSSFVVTKRDPFQMFESVKPLEINKLLSFKPIAVTDSIDDTTHKKKHQERSTESTRSSKRPTKRPTKKPQKNKTTIEPKSSTQFVPAAATPSNLPSLSAEDMYTAAKYTTLLSQTTAGFLPTPWHEPPSERTTRTTSLKTTTTELPITTTQLTTKQVQTTITTTTLTTPTSTTTTTEPTTYTTTTQIPLNSTFITTTECNDKKHQIKPSDLINLKKIIDEEFGGWSKPTTEPIQIKTTGLPINSDLLTGDMRNMLIALGILKNNGQLRDHMTTALTTTTTTTLSPNFLEQVFIKREPPSPTIDPNSYVSFKKIPIDTTKQDEKSPVSDDMKDLLASFGLLPRNSYRNSLHRMARHRPIIVADLPAENLASNTIDGANSSDPIASESSEYVENLDTIIPLPFNYQPHPNGHVFHPTVHLETLGDESKLQKINYVIDTIKNLVKSENITVQQIEERLENITSLIRDENLSDDPFLSEVANIISRTRNKIKSSDKINTDYNYKPDESSIVKTFSRANITDLTQKKAPNPLSSEELQQLLDANRNEVKRQQPNNTNNAPLPDLAASFGGGETASQEPSPEDLPTAKPNGLYFFVDWNTFLNVGEGDKNAVRVRFSPRAGNARNFLPITVP